MQRDLYVQRCFIVSLPPEGTGGCSSDFAKGEMEVARQYARCGDLGHVYLPEGIGFRSTYRRGLLPEGAYRRVLDFFWLMKSVIVDMMVSCMDYFSMLRGTHRRVHDFYRRVYTGADFTRGCLST